MSSEGLLENPALFSGKDIRQDVLASEYLDIVEKFPPGDRKAVKKHLFTFLYAGLQWHTDLRSQLGQAKSIQEMRDVADELRRRRENEETDCPDRGWYFRHRNPLGDPHREE